MPKRWRWRGKPYTCFYQSFPKMFLQQCKHFSNACFFYRRLGSSVPVLCHFPFPPWPGGWRLGEGVPKSLELTKRATPALCVDMCEAAAHVASGPLRPKNTRVGDLVLSRVGEWIATRRKDLPPGRPISNKFRYKGAPNFWSGIRRTTCSAFWEC